MIRILDNMDFDAQQHNIMGYIMIESTLNFLLHFSGFVFVM